MYGPYSQQMKDKLESLDNVLGYLIDQLKSHHLFDKLDLIITSDHGMESISKEKTIFLDSYVDTMSFAAAPAILVYQAVWRDFDLWGMLVAFAILASGVIRFSRSVVTQDRGHRHYFNGLPIPLSAMWMAMYILVIHAGAPDLREMFQYGPVSALRWICPLLFVILQVTSVPYVKPGRDALLLGSTAAAAQPTQVEPPVRVEAPPAAPAPSPTVTPSATTTPATSASSDLQAVSVESLPRVGTPVGPPPHGAGRVIITASPGFCTLFVDGKAVGATPIAGVDLATGPHYLRCEGIGGRTRTSNIVVQESTTVRYKFNFD